EIDVAIQRMELLGQELEIIAAQEARALKRPPQRDVDARILVAALDPVKRADELFHDGLAGTRWTEDEERDRIAGVIAPIRWLDRIGAQPREDDVLAVARLFPIRAVGSKHRAVGRQGVLPGLGVAACPVQRSHAHESDRGLKLCRIFAWVPDY